ncbi:flavin monoamine oxidase family protein [Thermoflavimicrobium daqui]|uniref:Amine oxidase n=1 Tax=Thermoflavimicrobium daqui TaxID=2137476 RepID=A0A364K433_9BACL|nr:flavin monoamine oxidase family protein [Thermoflavimicrobium daqui]RAL24051.1 amine oxidase [Thermoflavimicrobium daqui]
MSIQSRSRLTPSQMISIIRSGLKKTKTPKKIMIIGAGMSGLVAASLLKKTGHHVRILEASERVGGRIFTLRSPFTQGEYLEAGAMRIPNIHFLTLEYIKKFNLPLNRFINTTPNDLIYVNGINTRQKVYEKNPDILRYPVTRREKGKTAEELVRLALQPIFKQIRQHPRNDLNQIIRAFDKYSMDIFLRFNPIGPSLSSGAIEMIKVLTDIEGYPELAFTEILRGFLISINPFIRFYEITGGLDRLPKSFLPQLKNEILFNQKVVRVVQHPNSITVHATHTKTSKPLQIKGDLAIMTLPFSVLRFIKLEPFHSISHQKRKAIRELHYLAGTKIGIQFKNRFWEKEGMFGGKSVTDLPMRFAYYPSHGFGKANGVVLGSYTLEDDALIWERFSKKEAVLKNLAQLAKIHGKQIFKEFVTGTMHSWLKYPYTAGAIAMFKPTQETVLYPHILKPEGRLHFAGEHTSLTHGWIQGAIESGIRAAYEINQRTI